MEARWMGRPNVMVWEGCRGGRLAPLGVILGVALGLGAVACRRAPGGGTGSGVTRRAARGAEKDLRLHPRPDPRPGNAVALLLGPDAEGRRRLYQLAPAGGDPSEVRLPFAGSVASATTSEGGTAVALLSGREGGTAVALLSGREEGTAVALLSGREGGSRTLLRASADTGRAWREVAVASARLRLLKAVSPDGRTIVVERDQGDLAVVRVTASQGTEIPIRLPGAGRPMYGVAVSADGLRVAFSAVQEGCAWGVDRQARCPVSLYGLDLRAGTGKARPLALGTKPGQLRYHPQFEDARGDRLLFMTTEGDSSEGCLEHANRCMYAIHRMAFAGGKSVLVMPDAVLHHRAGDGTLSFRRLRPPGSSGFRWARSSLWIAPPGGSPRALIKERLALRTHWFAPGGRHLLITTEGGPEGRALEVVDRDGRPAWEALPGLELEAVGWAARPFPKGAGQLAPPRSIRHLREALQLARAGGGAGARVAWLGVTAARLGRVQPGARALPNREAALAWLREPGHRALVLTREAWCDLAPAARQAGAPLRVLGSVGTAGAVAEPGLALVVAEPGVGVEQAERPGAGAGQGARPAAGAGQGARPAAGAGGSTGESAGAASGAIFQLEPGRGKLVLERVALPREVRRGERLVVSLFWRVVEPPPAGWQVFVHLDGQGERILGDHPAALCGTAGWRAGELVEDRFAMEARSTTGQTSPGQYSLLVGWFAGTRRAAVTHPGSQNGRAPVGTIRILP